MDELTAQAKIKALDLGFSLAGVTTPDPPPHIAVFEHWLDKGRHGEMEYLANERSRARRKDPRVIMPDCQTILVLATNHAQPVDPDQGRALTVAAYAVGLDYHDVLQDRARQLVGHLRDLTGRDIPHRIYVDTGPVLERDLAQRAGLGWIGRNTCLINPRLGSYFFLAEILLGIALEVDQPIREDYCGTCSRCVRACPTGCILPDRTLDARRCISYLTIESRGQFPQDLRSHVDSWLFGCDICQQVCPWNQRFAQPTRDASFSPRPFLTGPDVALFLEWSDEQLQDAIHDTALTRAKVQGLRRNACIVAGNRADSARVPDLGRLLSENPDPTVRAQAAWALGRIGGDQARGFLVTGFREEMDPQVREEIRLVLAS